MTATDQRVAHHSARESSNRMLTGSQIRAARALLNWSAQDVADAAGLGYATVQRAERADGIPRTTAPRLFAIQHALEAAGVMFVGEGQTSHDGGPGVRLRR